MKMLCIVLVAAVCWPVAKAQNAGSVPIATTSTSTVAVGSDNRVTFRFEAPKAGVVTVGGDFMMGAPAAQLVKGQDGAWTYTTGPIPRDSYTYNFNVDGVMVLDTQNENFKENPNALFNFFDMPGPETDFMAEKDVPHGRVERVLYYSTTLKTERSMHVYLPPGFERMKGPLPVLYLLHGAYDNDLSFVSAGKVPLILDNLYAQGKLKDMIVVMPNGTVPRPPAAGGHAMLPVGADADVFAHEFLESVVPYVEKTYPVSKKREDRAIAGFSMGGIATLNLALWHPEMFAYVYPMSTGYFPAGVEEIDAKYSEVMKNVARHPFKVFAIGVGKQDTLMGPNCAATRKELDKYGIGYKYVELDGAHSFVFSRRFLALELPTMFR